MTICLHYFYGINSNLEQKPIKGLKILVLLRPKT